MAAVTVILVVVAGLIGLVIGSVLNVVADRVPAHHPPLRDYPHRYGHCDVPLKGWRRLPFATFILLRGRCAGCGTRIAARYPAVEGFTGFAFAGVTWVAIASTYPDGPAEVWALGVVTVAFLYFAAISILLTIIDLTSHRLPNAIVLPSYVIAGSLFALSALLGGEWDSLGRAAVGMAMLYAFYFLLKLVHPNGMGGGDVKLAGVIGIYLGWIGWGALAVGALAAFVYGGVFGTGLLIVGRARLKSAIPFGPWMLFGAWTGVLVGTLVGSWYLALLTDF